MELTQPKIEEKVEYSSGDIVHIAACLCPDVVWTLCGILDDSEIIDVLEDDDILCIVCDELEKSIDGIDCNICFPNL